MSRPQPYRCPAPGCNKSGKMSGVKQHYRDKHDPTIGDTSLEQMILGGIAIEAIASGDAMPRQTQRPTVWHRGFRRGLLFGMALGASVAFALSVGTVIACKQGVCPAPIAAMLK